MWGCSSNEDSGEDDDDVFLQNESDDEQFHFSPASLPKLQFRSRTQNPKADGMKRWEWQKCLRRMAKCG